MALLCPYCGAGTPQGARCVACRGLLDPLSRQASQNAMGPWFIRDDAMPFRPGCAYETLVAMVQRGKISKRTVLRGPTTRQFWCTAERTPGVSHLLGVCHNCRVDVQPTDSFCDECGAGFTVESDRQHLGLGAVHLLPGQATPDAIAAIGSAASPSRAADAEPASAEPARVATPDFGPLVHALRRKVRRQRVIMVLLVLALVGGAAGAVWFLAPPGSVQRWLDEQGIRFSSPGTSTPPSPASPAAPLPVLAPAPEPEEYPPLSPGKASAPQVDGPAPILQPAPEPEPPASPAAQPELDPREAAIPPGLAAEADAAVVQKAAESVQRPPDLRRALETRARQLRLRGYP